MNRETSLKRFFCLLILVLLSIGLAGCQDKSDDQMRISPNYQYEYQYWNVVNRGAFSIYPETILQDLEAGRTEALIPFQISTHPEGRTPPVLWSQADFLGVAEAVYQKVWGESLDGWKVGTLYFLLDCVDADAGPQIMRLQLYKPFEPNEVGTRFVRSIYMMPHDGMMVDWDEKETLPLQEEWPSLDLNAIQFPAEKVLQTAEDRGGRDVRLKTENACQIYITYGAYKDQLTGEVNEGWVAFYVTYEYSPDGYGIFTVDPKDFQLRFDPATGEIK